MRQQVIALYRMFQEQRLLNLEKRAIDYEKEFVGGMTGLDGEDIAAMRLKHREALAQISI